MDAIAQTTSTVEAPRDFFHAPEVRVDRWRTLNRIARELVDAGAHSATQDPTALLAELGPSRSSAATRDRA